MKVGSPIPAVLMSLFTLVGIRQTASEPDTANLLLTLVCAAASFVLWRRVFRKGKKKARKKVPGKAAAPVAKPVSTPSPAPQLSVVKTLSADATTVAPAQVSSPAPVPKRISITVTAPAAKPKEERMLLNKSMPSATETIKRGNAVSTQIGLNFQSANSARQRFIAFDVETTGFQPASDRIVEIGAVLFLDGKPAKTFSSLVNPGIHMPAEASRVNHITDDMLATAPTEREIYPKLIDFLGDALRGKIIMCAHNASFDFGFLCATLSRLGFDASIQYMDTLGIARKYLRGLENHKQGTIEAHYGLVNAASHRASTDAENCGHILCRLLDEAEEDLISEQRRHEESKPTQQEMMVCAYVQQLIGAKGGNTALLRYKKNSTGYVDMCCLYPFLRMKFSQKGRYLLIKKDYALPESILTTACSQSEGGHAFVRAFFSSPFDLETLTDYIFDAYSAKRSSMEFFSTRNNYTRRETEEAMRAMHALTDEEAAALVDAARGCEYAPVSLTTTSKAEEKAKIKAEKARIKAEKAAQKATAAAMPKKHLGRAILQKDDEGNIIKEFVSVSAAAQEFGIDPKSIRSAAKGVQKHAGGFCWAYKE